MFIQRDVRHPQIGESPGYVKRPESLAASLCQIIRCSQWVETRRVCIEKGVLMSCLKP